MSDFGYEKLAVWKLGMDLVEDVYRITRKFPKEELFGLTSQMRRSACSVPSNIAEGYGRDSKTAFANFIRIAQGSLFELRTQLEIARRIDLVTSSEIEPLIGKAVELSKMLEGFLRKLLANE